MSIDQNTNLFPFPPENGEKLLRTQPPLILITLGVWVFVVRFGLF